MTTEKFKYPEEFGNKRNIDFSWELVYQEKPSHKHIIEALLVQLFTNAISLLHED